MATVERLEEREGLFYPYVHIRDEEWLKKTLIVFPSLVRMIADDFTPDDSVFVRSLVNGNDHQKPLLRRAKLDTPNVETAMNSLRSLIENDLKSDKEAFLN
jgi:hypothetical protein